MKCRKMLLMNKSNQMKTKIKQPAGFVLLTTMIVLVVLASLTTGLAVQMSMAKRRQHYMIEYQRARYGLDSAMKYILNVLPRKNFILVSRSDQPDFSDVFLMNQDEFAAFIASWAETATEEQLEGVLKEGASLTKPDVTSEQAVSGLLSLFGLGGAPDANEVDTDSYGLDESFYVVELDPKDVVVPGPYGVPWPYVMEPIDLEIGPCKVTITIEDENAKLPLSWLITNSIKADKTTRDALKTFCEWMSWDQNRLSELEAAITEAADEIYKKKAFTLNPSPVILKTAPAQAAGGAAPADPRSRARRRRTPRRTPQRTVTETRPAIAHTTDFAKLFHSSLLDRELLARPLPDTGDRIESPLKYLSLWGAQRVNVNTAPRHVLEAAFALAEVGSFDLPELTQNVIEARQENPLETLDELKSLGRLNADTMNNLNNYLTTTSTFFQIRITSRSGNARSSAVATVVKEGNKTERLMILYE